MASGGVPGADSGLVEVGAHRFVVADDELWLGVFPATGGPGKRLALFSGSRR
jgi:hypothetical protein